MMMMMMMGSSRSNPTFVDLSFPKESDRRGRMRSRSGLYSEVRSCHPSKGVKCHSPFPNRAFHNQVVVE